MKIGKQTDIGLECIKQPVNFALQKVKCQGSQWRGVLGVALLIPWRKQIDMHWNLEQR